VDTGAHRWAWASVAAAIATITLKAAAWWITGSVGLLSDALESVVNLLAAVLTLTLLAYAARPPDEGHPYGHQKAEYFASGAEGALILLAAVGIAWTAAQRLLAPAPIAHPGAGLLLSCAASAVNFGVARLLLVAARRHRSIALEADARHLLTDVWTSAGVVAGVGLVWLTGWERLDPIVALAVAAHILRTGLALLRRSALGLMDTQLPEEDQRKLAEALARHVKPPIQVHALRTHQAAARRFVSMHVLVPGDWSVRRGHGLLERIERDVRAALPNAIVQTHLEALETKASWEDEELP
jgi:cation diffusion facilitator family transporter